MKRYFIVLRDSLTGVGNWAILFVRTIIAHFKSPPSWPLILDQLYEIGVLSLFVVAITGFSTGLVLAAQSFYQFADKGLASATGLFVGKGMITEIGPILTAFMVTGRVGSAITASIGTMNVSEQIAALRSMSVDPLSYLVSPRIIAFTVMLPILTMFSAIMGIFGGYLISVFAFHMTPQGYFDPMPEYITYFDIFILVVKSIIFGLLISSIACYKGFTTQGGALGVGKATTKSVVTCYIFILILNFLVTIGLNTLYQNLFGELP